MADVSLIPTDELIRDLKDVKNDIVACKTGLAIGVTEYLGNSVQQRLDTNRQVKQIIEAELQRRLGEETCHD